MLTSDPVVLCHPACSGGSLIYRIIVAKFDLVGISEISHRFPFASSAFIPTDPERALLAIGQISESEFGTIFLDRIRNTNEICQRLAKPLLIREHTHSYFFFNDSDLSVPDHPSWIADQYLKQFDKRIKCIVTVRDPVDSWLGLFANFPRVTPKNFLEYCSRYERFIRLLFDNHDQQTMLLVRYEDIIERPSHELQRIADFIGIAQRHEDAGDWQVISSTGNSGRQSNKLQKRTRRPFGRKLIKDAEQSESYRYLTEQLGYPHIIDSISPSIKIRARLVDMRRKFASLLYRFSTRIQKWASTKSRIP